MENQTFHSSINTKLETQHGIDPEKKANLRDFSKRYSLERDAVAARIKLLKQEFRQKRAEFQTEKQNRDDQRMGIEGEISNLEGGMKELEELVNELRSEIDERKRNIWSKIADLFKQSEVRAKLEALAGYETSLEELKKNIEDRYRLLSEIEDVVEDDSIKTELVETLVRFYQKQNDEKNELESEDSIRNVKELSLKNEALFLHGIPAIAEEMNETAQNNPSLKTKELSFEDKLKLLISVEPTISTFGFKQENGVKFFYPCGVGLKGGRVLSAYKGDTGSFSHSAYKKVSKYDRNLTGFSIQPDIENRVQSSLENVLISKEYLATDEDRSAGHGWNEIIIENPEVGFLYADLRGNTRKTVDLSELKQLSESLKIPLYARLETLQGEIWMEVTDVVDSRLWREVNEKEMLEGEKKWDNAERVECFADVLEKKPFEVKREIKDNFDVFNRGRILYHYLKRLQNGEQVVIDCDRNDKAHVKQIPGANTNEPYFLTTFGAYKIRPYVGDPWNTWEKWGGWFKYNEDEKKYDFNWSSEGAHISQSAHPYVIEGEPNFSIEYYIHSLDASIKAYAKEKGGNKDWRYVVQRFSETGLFMLYGLAQEALKDGNNTVAEKCNAILDQYGFSKKCEQFISERLGVDGSFQVLEKDIPFEIRKHNKEISSSIL